MVAAELVSNMVQVRRDLHRHPEIGFAEHQTAEKIVRALREAGFGAIETGIGGTGVVASLRGGAGNHAIALRADMDALQIEEATGLAHSSQRAGLMHACGHDGHVATLLGAALHLAQARAFDGVVHFIFQPAEEWGQGMAAMLADDLLARFPVEEAYGFHNLPGLAVGEFATAPGPVMAAEDLFEIEISGSGGHAARPQATADALVAACAVVTALQTLVARHIDPGQVAVVSATELVTDGTRNAIASTAKIRGDCRSFRPEISQKIEAAMARLTQGIAQSHGCAARLSYDRAFIPLENHPEATDHAVAAAREIGPTEPQAPPIAASEDFARLTARIPGNYMFIGNGDSETLHHPGYEFDDGALPYGIAYLTRLVESRLPRR